MRGLISSCAAGKAGDRIVLDLGQEEDNFGQADVPLAVVPRTGEIVLLQMDGHLTREEFDEALKLATDAALNVVYPLQVAALKRKYSMTTESVENGVLNGTLSDEGDSPSIPASAAISQETAEEIVEKLAPGTSKVELEDMDTENSEGGEQ